MNPALPLEFWINNSWTIKLLSSATSCFVSIGLIAMQALKDGTSIGFSTPRYFPTAIPDQWH